MAREFKRGHPDFDLRIIDEDNKGTGYAASTGFDYAINELGARVVARTDGDAVPVSRWLSRGVRRLHSDNPGRKAVTGMVWAAKDEHYKFGDRVVWPAYVIAAIALRMVVQKESDSYKYMPGGNTIVRAAAYEEVGGYPLSAIEERCEDIALTRALLDRYGRRSIARVPGVDVCSSMRRVRSIGYRGMLECYVLKPDDKDVRLRVNRGNMDHR